MAIIQNDSGESIYPARGKMVVSEGVTSASPVVIDVTTGLGGGKAHGNRGWLSNDGTIDMNVEIALEGTSYMTSFTLKAGRNMDLTGMHISSIRLSQIVSATTYQAVIW